MSELESLATEEGLGLHLRRHALDRLLMLCDGVFAISATLAAIDIHVPSQAPSLSAVLHGASVQLVTYFISFIVIAVFWISNRDLFARVHRVDRGLTVLTLLMLCVVALIPASTHVAQSGDRIDGSLRFYAVTMVASGSLNCVMWIYASFRRGLMFETVSRQFRWHRIIIAATLPLIFSPILIVPTTGSLKWMSPVVIIAVVLRSVLLPRLFKGEKHNGEVA